MMESNEYRNAMTSRIEAICPNSYRRIYVTDDWYPSFTDVQTGKLYVECYVHEGGVVYGRVRSW